MSQRKKTERISDDLNPDITAPAGPDYMSDYQPQQVELGGLGTFSGPGMATRFVSSAHRLPWVLIGVVAAAMFSVILALGFLLSKEKATATEALRSAQDADRVAKDALEKEARAALARVALESQIEALTAEKDKLTKKAEQAEAALASARADAALAAAKLKAQSQATKKPSSKKVPPKKTSQKKAGSKYRR